MLSVFLEKYAGSWQVCVPEIRHHAHHPAELEKRFVLESTIATEISIANCIQYSHLRTSHTSLHHEHAIQRRQSPGVRGRRPGKILQALSESGSPSLTLLIMQKNYKDSEINEAERYKEGKPNSHLAQDSSTFSAPPSSTTTMTDQTHNRGQQDDRQQARPRGEGTLE